MQKTNALRILDSAKINYETFEYDNSITNGEMVAAVLGEKPDCVFKTLVTVSGKDHFVFVIPVKETLDMKKAARAAGVKSVEMLHQKDLLPLTGYIHGGCSPVGMKKQFKTFVEKSAENLQKFYVSAGKVGMQMKISPSELKNLIHFEYADLIFENH
ncbi:MAG: Cys-tRNA(Pro) deacylase [Clostridia bacterium]|nr:Cys-tRNA(Pro) deacylase [Clostridia bacterium]